MNPTYRRTLIFEKHHPHETVWMLTQQSRQQAGNSPMLREGNKRTRDDFSTLTYNPMNKDLHATSRIELTVPTPGSWRPGDLVAFIASAMRPGRRVGSPHATSGPAPSRLQDRPGPSRLPQPRSW